MTDGGLRDAGQLIEPLVVELGVALGCPVSDAPLLALARRLAATIDAMPDAMAGTMLPNHAGPMIKILAELEHRANARAKSAGEGRGNRVTVLRSAVAESGRRRRGV